MNNKEIVAWEEQEEPLHAVLDRLGEEGWELTTTYSSLRSLLFQRQGQSRR